MALNYAERLLLLQALIVRRVPLNSRISSILLMEALQADNALVQAEQPDLYYQHFNTNLAQEVDICIDVGYIEDGVSPRKTRFGKNRSTPKPPTYRRTEEGNRLLNSFERRLEDALDSMPMSDVGLLDFLSLL